MRNFIHLVIILLSFQIYSTMRVGKSIDQIIMEAAPSHTMFDVMHDMGGGKMMMMTELDMLMEIDEYARYRSPHPIRYRRKATADDARLWDDCQVYYELTPGDFSPDDRNVIMTGINDWKNYTCLKFTESSTEPNRILFRNGGGCYSRLGKVGGVQPIGLAPGCRTRGVVVHEIGHAIGWIHEQARPDRDDFIFVNFTKIPPNWRAQFDKVESSLINDRGVTYDYDSVMHYAGTVFGRGTILTRDPADQNRIGQRQGLSFRDIKIANLMYQCAETMGCRSRSCPGEGFQGGDCKCHCPGPISNPIVSCDGVTEGPSTTQLPTTTAAPTTPTTTLVPPPPDCIDLRSNCPELRRNGSCTTDVARMSVFCRQTCNLCNTVAACMDYEEGCPWFAAKGYCDRDGIGVLFQQECPLSCKTCTPTDPCIAARSDPNTGSRVTMTSALATMIVFAVVIHL